MDSRIPPLSPTLYSATGHRPVLGTEGLAPSHLADRSRPADAVLLAPLSPATEPVVADSPDEPVARAPSARRPWPNTVRGWVEWTVAGVDSLVDWLFGAASLIVGLAVLSAIPPLFLLSLGYLLEVSGRIARTGHFTAGFVGVRKAAVVGRILFGSYIVLFPLRLTLSMAVDGRLIDPTSAATRNWAFAHSLLSIVLGIHVIVACARGAKLRHFLWPFPAPWKLYKVAWWLVRLPWRVMRRVFSPVLRMLGWSKSVPAASDVSETTPIAAAERPRWRREPLRTFADFYRQSRDNVWDFVVSLRLPYYFWLGARGFAGTFLWLFIPVTLLAGGDSRPVLAFLGAILLAWVVLYLPFLQIRFAAENRFKAIFEWRAVRQQFLRAPLAFWFGLTATLLFALPLYLAKIEMVPREIGSLLSLVFVLFIFPARLLTGWAYARSLRRETARHWLIRWPSRLAMVPVAAFYVLVVFFTPYLAWYGKVSLYEQHAFLVPVPFLNM